MIDLIANNIVAQTKLKTKDAGCTQQLSHFFIKKENKTKGQPTSISHGMQHD
jgi:hypothetical protein